MPERSILEGIERPVLRSKPQTLSGTRWHGYVVIDMRESHVFSRTIAWSGRHGPSDANKHATLDLQMQR